MNKVIVSPSILSADFANLERDIKKIEKAGAHWVHVDVMDGHFVPNITIGAPVVKAVRKVTTMPLDVHLMIENPERYIKDFVDAGSDIITVHQEACQNNLKEILETIRIYGIKAGVSIKPKTPVKVLEEVITSLDLILIMTVEPGFGGQGFMHECLPKIKETKDLLNHYKLTDVHIEVDGGINEETAKLAKEAGANALVAGSYIYNAPDIQAAIESLILCYESIFSSPPRKPPPPSLAAPPPSNPIGSNNFEKIEPDSDPAVLANPPAADDAALVAPLLPNELTIPKIAPIIGNAILKLLPVL